MSTTERMPARAAAAATALARLPVDGQASTLKPSSMAAASATPTTRSLNECVGLAALVLDPQLAHAKHIRELVGADQPGPAGLEVRPGGDVRRHRQQAGVPPHAQRA